MKALVLFHGITKQESIWKQMDQKYQIILMKASSSQ